MKRIITPVETPKSEKTTKQWKNIMNTKNTLIKTEAFALVGIFAAIMPLGAQTVWEGTNGNDWNTAANWSNGVPTSSTAVTIALDGANVTMSAAGNTANMTVSGGGATTPTLNITQNLSTNGSLTVGSAGGTGYKGIVNHTAGTVQTTGVGRLYIAYDGSGSGTYNFGGAEPTAPIATIGGSVIMGHNTTDNGLLSLSEYGTISGNDFVMSSSNGTSEWRVSGGNLDIDFAGKLSISHSGFGTATLRAIIDNTGFSTINFGGNVEFGRLDLTANSSRFVLELGNGYAHVPGTEFMILDAVGDFTRHAEFGQVNGSVYTPGASFTVDGYEFSAAYLTGENVNSQFVVTAIPEPSSLLLLGLIAPILVLRRRRHLA